MATYSFQPLALDPSLGGTNKSTTLAGTINTGTSTNPSYSTVQGGVQIPQTTTMGTTALSPAPKPQTNTLPSNQIDYNANPYYLRPGETQDAYNTRVAAYNASKTQTPSAPPSGSSAPQQPQAPTQPQTNPNSNPYTSTAPSFGGLIGNLANFGQTSPSEDPAVVNARQNLLNLQNQQAQLTAQHQGYGNDLPTYTGEQGLINQLYASKTGAAQSALQTATEAALQGRGLQQQAVGQAAGLTAPQPYGITQTPFFPGQGQTGQFGTLPSGQTGAGGLFGAGQALGNLAAGQTFQQTIAPAYNAASGIYGNLNTFLQNNPDINPTSANWVNFWNSWARGSQLSDPKYQQMSQYLNEFLNTLTPLVGSPGEITNYKQQIVNAMINPTASVGSLTQQLSNLFGIATQKYQSIYQTGQGATTPPPSTSTGGTTFGSFFGTS